MAFHIDHIVIAVADLAAAVSDYGGLGFTVTPGGEHPRGSRNALICFADGAYLEIIAFSRPLPEFRWWRVLERAGSGLVDHALLPDDLDARLAEARARGLDLDGPIEGERRQPDGTRIAWRSARPPEADIPFFCADVTPHGWRVPEGEARRHANGVTGIASITVAVADLAVAAARYRALLGQAGNGAAAETVFALNDRQSLRLSDGTGLDAARAHRAARGEGPCALALYGPAAVRLDPARTHGAPLTILA